MPAANFARQQSSARSMRLKPKFVGKAVVLSDGKAGMVEIVSLEEDHGLRISIGAMSEAGPFQQSNSREVRSGVAADPVLWASSATHGPLLRQ